MVFKALVMAFLLGVSGISYGFDAGKQEAGSENSATTYVSETSTAQSDEQLTEPTRDEVSQLTADKIIDCERVCHQVVVLDGIDSAESICGEYGAENPIYRNLLTYKKCAKPEIVEGVTADATKLVKDSTAPFDADVSNEINSRGNFCFSEVDSIVDNVLQSRAKEHGLDISIFRRDTLSNDECFSTEQTIIGPAPVSLALSDYGQNLGHALFNVKRVVNEGSDHWRNPGSCAWLADLFGAKPFCEANKDFSGCEQLLDIYGNCEKILADAANKNEL